ncbi:MAG: hypothetical protein AB7I50_03090 [Vicinamibacterales bacterium]
MVAKGPTQVHVVYVLSVFILASASCIGQDVAGPRALGDKWKTYVMAGVFKISGPPDLSLAESQLLLAGEQLQISIGGGDPLPANDVTITRLLGEGATKSRIDGRQVYVRASDGSHLDPSRPFLLYVLFPDTEHGASLAVSIRCRDEQTRDVARQMIATIRFLPYRSSGLPEPPPPPGPN